MILFRDIKQDVQRNPQKKVLKKHGISGRFIAPFMLAAAVLIASSISGTLFGFPGSGNFLGELLADSYGAIAFVIPAYLIFAAYILFDKTFRPGRIFVLNCIIFPFITLSIGFSYLRDFDFFSAQMPVLGFFGKNGFGFLMIFFTVMECVAIAAFSTWLFPPVIGRKLQRPPHERDGEPEAAGEHNARDANEIRIIRVPIQKEFLPPPPPSNVSGNKALFHEVTSRPITGADKAALEEAYEKAQAELEKYTIQNLDSTLDDLNDKLKFIDEIEQMPEMSGEADLTPATGLVDGLVDDFEPCEPLTEAAAPPASTERLETKPAREYAPAVEEAAAITEITGEEPFNEEPFNEEFLGEEPFVEEPLEFEIEDEFDEPIEGDLEKLITRAENEAAQKTEEYMQKQQSLEKQEPAGSAAHNLFAKKKNQTGFSVPVDGLLADYEDDQYWLIDEATKKSAAVLKETLNEFNIQAEVTGIRKGPVITMFEILPSPGVKLSKIVNLQDNIALRLAASPVRIVAPIPGKHAVGIEIPNKKRSIVSFKDIISTQLAKGDAERKKWGIPVVLGKDITGGEVTVDLTAMPHLLIAGATGSGKSVCVNTMILSILYQCAPWQCRLILIDPKIVELKLYNDIPHLLTPVITEPKRAFQALQYCICEMERRYACLDSMGVRDIKTYNKRIKERNIAAEYMPYIVVVIDEFADLMATTGKELESTVARLAAMSRAVGIHIVLATQRPSIDVITGLIKSNIPSRIAFMVASMMDSRIIIDTTGAEKLLGKGDMLYSGITDPFPVRMQGAFVSEDEVERVVAHVKTLGEPDYIDEEIFIDDEETSGAEIYTEGDDPLYDKALEIVVQQGKASASYIQRRLKIGYNRAARLVEEMENRGVVGPAQGSRPRDLLRAV
jgi:S-DNA-T family DNA segregation ATPase FtsK/SpoIIIE